MLRLLIAQPDIILYAPQQAVLAMRSRAAREQELVFDRVNGVALEYQDPPVTLSMDKLKVEAVRIPHSGWPTDRLNVQNIVWRVTLDERSVVVHMGDDDSHDVHFARDSDYWVRSLRIWLFLRTGFLAAAKEGIFWKTGSAPNEMSESMCPERSPEIRCRDHGRCAEQIYSWCPARPAVSTDMASDKFRFPTLTAVVIANMVGTGVFTSLGFQLLDIRSGFALLALWAIGAWLPCVGP